MLEGAPVLRTSFDERALRRGDVVCFPAGPDGGHQVRGPGAVLIIWAIRPFDAVEYPEAGTVELRPSGRQLRSDTPPSPGTAGKPVNIDDLPLELDSALPAGYRHRATRLRGRLGAEQLGGSLYELDPGESTFPYHYEGVEEEWLLVLGGTPSLRDPAGEHELTPGDIVAFPPTPEGAHKVTNRSGAVSRFLILSTIPAPDVSISVYPDSEKLSVWPPGKRLRMAESLDYWDGEA